jgi:uncharacterized membrane protein
METKGSHIAIMIGLATVAFGLLAAGAWNKFIADLLAIWLKPGAGVIGEFIYAVIVTVIAIWVIQFLSKVAERTQGPRV